MALMMLAAMNKRYRRSMNPLLENRSLSRFVDAEAGAGGDGLETPEVDMTDPINRYHKLRLRLRADVLACCMSWVFFVSAAFNPCYTKTLVPFPPFCITDRGEENIALVHSIIFRTPLLAVVREKFLGDEYDEIDADVLQLLDWLLVEIDVIRLRTVSDAEYDQVLALLGNNNTAVQKPTKIFQVCSLDIYRNLEFNAPNRQTAFGFFASAMEEYFCISISGFPVNRNVRPYGEMAVYTDIATVIQRSLLASISGLPCVCVALIEYVNDSEYITSSGHGDEKQVHITKDDLKRCPYMLYYYMPALAPKRTPKFFLWFESHRQVFSLGFYMLISTLASIVSIASGKSCYGVLREFFLGK